MRVLLFERTGGLCRYGILSGKSIGSIASFTMKRVTAIHLKIIAASMATINAIAGINYCGDSLLDIFYYRLLNAHASIDERDLLSVHILHK